MFNKLKERSTFHREDKDCTVKMMALVMGTSYEDAWNITAKLGRKPRKGMASVSLLFPHLEAAGLTLIETSVHAKTIKTLDRSYHAGRYIVQTSGHILFHKDGKTYDWTQGRQHRIKRIWRVSGDVDATMINPACDTLELDYYSRTKLASKARTRSSNYCWKLINVDSGETLAQYKRKPTKVIENVYCGGRVGSDPKAQLAVRSIRKAGKPTVTYTGPKELGYRRGTPVGTFAW